jgi:hypothetical protein
MPSKRNRNTSQSLERILMNIQYTYNTPYFTTVEIIKKLERFNVYPDFLHMKNSEKKEIKNSIKENT